MSTTHYVLCHDCKVYRDLDKFTELYEKPQSTAEMLELAHNVRTHNVYRPTLLLTFMGLHANHSCTVCSEHECEPTGDNIADGQPIICEYGELGTRYYPEPVNYWDIPQNYCEPNPGSNNQ